MYWKDMNPFQRILYFASIFCTIIFIVLGVLILADSLAWDFGYIFIFQALSAAANSVLYWKSQRKRGIIWLVLTGAWLLLFFLEVFI